MICRSLVQLITIWLHNRCTCQWTTVDYLSLLMIFFNIYFFLFKPQTPAILCYRRPANYCAAADSHYLILIVYWLYLINELVAITGSPFPFSYGHEQHIWQCLKWTPGEIDWITANHVSSTKNAPSLFMNRMMTNSKIMASRKSVYCWIYSAGRVWDSWSPHHLNAMLPGCIYISALRNYAIKLK